MTIVVDASVAVHWTIPMPLSAAAERLLRSGVTRIAPEFVVAEVTNAFWSYLRQRPEMRNRLSDGLEFLPHWFSELAPAAGLRQRAMAIAIELDHPAYDCFYLALAESRRTRLVTTDERLIAKLRGAHAGRIVHLREWVA